MKPIAACRLCPRECGIDRTRGEIGYCRAGADAVVYRYAPHFGEEPPISGRAGSGTIFFSSCTMRCLYCQNYPWSQEGEGSVHSVAGLCDALCSLHEAGCHNWNLVSPTPWLAHIQAAVDRTHERGVSLPVVWNTSGFESTAVLRAYEDLVDIYLTDLRYASPATAAEGSHAASYVETARTAVREMWRQKGPLRTDDHGIAVSGVVCRILVLPGRAGEAVANLEWLAATIGADLAISVMAQYMPAHQAAKHSAWNRSISQEEYDTVSQAVDELGFGHGWVQDRAEGTPPDLVGYRMEKT